MAASALLAAGLVAVAEDAATPAAADRHAVATVRLALTVWSDGSVTLASADTVALADGRGVRTTPARPVPVPDRGNAGPEWPTSDLDRCPAITTRGARCKLRVRPNQPTCRYHEDQSVPTTGQ